MKNKTGFDKDSISLSLLNINCLGIGYFMAGLKLRGLIALAVNLGLLAAGHIVNASEQPVLWGSIFLAVYVGMTVDLWLILRKHPERVPEKLSAKTWLLPVLCTTVLILFFGGFFAYRVAGNKVIDKGIEAYEQDDFSESFRYLYSAKQLYRLSLNPRIIEIENNLDEVGLINTAQNYSTQQRYEEAVQCVEKMHEYYPQSSKISSLNEMAVGDLMAWAEEFQSNDQYQACYEVYKTIWHDFPEETKTQKDVLNEVIAENYLKWGEYLSGNAEYESAIEKFELIVNNNPQSAVYEDAYQSAAQAFYDLALQVKEQKKFDESVGYLKNIEEAYPGYESMQTVRNEMPDLLLQYGAALWDEKEFFKSIEQFEDVAQYTKDEEILAEAEEDIQDTYLRLANVESPDGDKVINSALNDACEGNPVEHPAIDILPEEQGTARACGNKNKDYIPGELRPGKPGSFRYAIEVEEDADRYIASCGYGIVEAYYTLERWQDGKKFIVRKVKTGEIVASKTFYGSYPDECPSRHSFSRSERTDYLWGDDPGTEEVQSWLETVLK